jgi:hypothetical protein
MFSACKSDDVKDDPECNQEEGRVEKVDNKVWTLE